MVVWSSSAAGAVVALLTYSKAGHGRILKAVLAGGASAAVAFLARVLSRAVVGLQRELYPVEEWVAQYDEDAVDTDIAILDAHHHLWDVRTQDKGWPVPSWALKVIYCMKPRIVNDIVAKDAVVVNSFGRRSPMACPYMGEELTQDIRGRSGKGHNVVDTIYIECGWHTPGVDACMAPVKETDMVTEVHRKFPSVLGGIVAHADLRFGAEVEPALQYYRQNPLVKGIRHSFAWSDDDSIMNGPCDKDMAYDPKFREGFALLAKYGYSFDTWLFHEQVDGLADLAKAFPDTTVICDHIGFPLGIGKYKKEEVLPTWKESMKKLAEAKNVYVKIGGLGMRFPGFGFDEKPTPPSSDELAEAWGPYVRFVVETFGADRCIMESNYPMDKVSCSYTVLFNALKKTVRSYSKEDRQKMFEHNARRVYRMPSAPSTAGSPKC